MIEKPDYRLWERNVRDEYKSYSTDDIKRVLKENAFPYAVMMAQISGDFNFGAVVRAANNFGASKVFYFGKRRYDKRSAVGTNHYTNVIHLESFEQIVSLKSSYRFVGLDNNVEKPTTPIKNYKWEDNSVIIIGEENSGIPRDVLDLCDDLVEIPSMGSVRSLNAAVAASIALYDYTSKYDV